MTPNVSSTAAMVVVGNEILSGKVADTNSPFLARQLRAAGVTLERVIVIPDDIGTIAEVVGDYAARYDHVFTSGGVGPTHDDMTIAGVALAFGRPVVVDDGLRRAIETAIGSKPGHPYMKMAEVPEGARLIETEPGHFPTVVVENVYVLPGIPEIFEAKILGLLERFRTQPFHLRQILCSASEGRIAEYLNATLAAFPDLMLGSYPKLSDPEYRVRLTLESKDEAYLEKALGDLIARMPADYIVRVVR
jgi:molybdenum cofactor synthesis domain-containing protein